MYLNFTKILILSYVITGAEGFTKRKQKQNHTTHMRNQIKWNCLTSNNNLFTEDHLIHN